MNPLVVDTPPARPPRRFAPDARQLAMLDAMGVRLEWLRSLERAAGGAAGAGTAAAAVPAPEPQAARPLVEPASAVARPAAPDQVPAPVPAAVPARARAAAPADPAADVPAAGPAARAAPARRQALMPGAAPRLLADPPRLLHGPADATGGWLVVADMAPDALGRHDADPRAGDEGRLLDAMLRALQLHAGAVPVHLVRLHRGAAQTGPDAPQPWDAVRPAHAEPLAPRMVLALGPLAAQALLGRDGPIGKLRGQAQPLDAAATGAGAAQVVASYHPAFLLKNPQAKAKAWADLCLAASLFEGGTYNPHP